MEKFASLLFKSKYLHLQELQNFLASLLQKFYNDSEEFKKLDPRKEK